MNVKAFGGDKMKRLIYCFSVILLLALVKPVAALDIKVGDRFHITGCENGELMVPVVNMWDRPGGQFAGGKVVGKLSGNGREDQGELGDTSHISYNICNLLLRLTV